MQIYSKFIALTSVLVVISKMEITIVFVPRECHGLFIWFFGFGFTLVMFKVIHKEVPS